MLCVWYSSKREAERRDIVAGDLWAFDTMSPPQYPFAPPPNNDKN